MSSTSRVFVLLLAVALAAVAVTVAPAFAQGGGCGAANQAPPASYCPQDPDGWSVVQPDGSTIFANEGSGAGCVFVHSYVAGYLRLDSRPLGPGWTYVARTTGGGTWRRAELQVRETATGKKVDCRTESGQTRTGSAALLQPPPAARRRAAGEGT